MSRQVIIVQNPLDIDKLRRLFACIELEHTLTLRRLRQGPWQQDLLSSWALDILMSAEHLRLIICRRYNSWFQTKLFFTYSGPRAQKWLEAAD